MRNYDVITNDQWRLTPQIRPTLHFVVSHKSSLEPYLCTFSASQFGA